MRAGRASTTSPPFHIDGTFLSYPCSLRQASWIGFEVEPGLTRICREPP